MTDADKDPTNARGVPRRQNRRMIPTSAANPQYADDLDRYLDQLLDDALEGTFSAGDPLAVPTRRELERK